MEEINIINNLSSLLLILIDLGCVMRIVFCAIMMNSNENEQIMKKRIKHTIIFVIVANVIGALNSFAQHYWG